MSRERRGRGIRRPTGLSSNSTREIPLQDLVDELIRLASKKDPTLFEKKLKQLAKRYQASPDGISDKLKGLKNYDKLCNVIYQAYHTSQSKFSDEIFNFIAQCFSDSLVQFKIEALAVLTCQLLELNNINRLTGVCQ